MTDLPASPAAFIYKFSCGTHNFHLSESQDSIKLQNLMENMLRTC